MLSCLSCALLKCIVNIRVIIAFMNSSLYSCETYRQVKEMVILHLFIEHHYKSIVSIIREKACPYSSLVPQLTEESSSLLAAAARMQLHVMQSVSAW